VLNVGGWFDAEDPMGPFHIFRSVERNNPGTENMLVMGPWSHGGWSRGDGERLGNLDFGVKTAAFFRDQIQFPFFMQYLKDKPAGLPKAYMFLTGINEWRREAAWPPQTAKEMTLFLNAGGLLKTAAPAGTGLNSFDEYVSDPNRPVPYLGYIVSGLTSDYLTEDQRFAAQRTDVLAYQTEPLTEDLTIAGPIQVRLNVSTSGTDSDFIVKLIDVYPNDYPTPPLPEGQRPTANAVKMGGYEQLVRGEPFRAKFRNSFEKPEPMVSGQPTVINFTLPDAYHAFRRGHRIMIQVQSTWFPLVDRNPQKFVEIPRARPENYQKATQRVYHSHELSSSVTLLIEGATPGIGWR